MFNRILNDPDLLCNEFKICPCVVPKTIDESKPVKTVIERWRGKVSIYQMLYDLNHNFQELLDII